MRHEHELYSNVTEILELKKVLRNHPARVPARKRRELAAKQLHTAATLIEQAATELNFVYGPSQTSELLVIAGRIQLIKEKRTAEFQVDDFDGATDTPEAF